MNSAKLSIKVKYLKGVMLKKLANGGKLKLNTVLLILIKPLQQFSEMKN